MFSGFFSSSPPGASIMQMLVLLMLPQRFLKLSSFLYILFSLLHSVTLISIILSSRLFMHSSASVILLLIPSRYFSLWLFISVHFCLFLLQIFYLIVKNFLYPLNLCLILFPRFLIIFTIITMNSFSIGCPSSLHLVVLTGFYLVPSSATFLCCLILSDFLCLWSLFHRLCDSSSSCFGGLTPGG